MGTDEFGKYFKFFDNATSDISKGTSTNNKLYIRENTLEIIGFSDNKYATETQYGTYQLTQIRESKPK